MSNTETSAPEQPKRIAVLGASTDRSKFGNKCVRAYADEGWEVFPINPNAEEVEGHRTGTILGDIEPDLDRISVYLPPSVTLMLLPEIAAKGAREVWFNPGSVDDEVLATAHELEINAIAECSIVDIGRHPDQYANT